MEKRIILALHAGSLDCTWGMGRSKFDRLVIIDPAFLIRLVSGSIALDIPSIVYHEFEVFIIIDGRRNIGVVFNKFLDSYGAVSSLTRFQIVMCLKGFKEFNKNTVFGPLSLEDIRMLTSIKGLFDVGDFNESIAILINGVEGFLDESNSAFVHGVPD